MFTSSIKSIKRFTRPIQTISRNYGSNEVVPGLSTLFFVNENAVAVTCKHVSQLILSAGPVNQKFAQFSAEKAALTGKGNYDEKLKELEAKYNFQSDTTVQIKNSFVDSVDRFEEIKVHQHPKYDLAIIEFRGYNKILYQSHARFLKDSSKIEQGKYLCRLGYPFPEYRNFRYNPSNDDILFDNSVQAIIPVFPMDGMVTRDLVENGEVMGIEMSTPGLRGQSGGPLFDENGIIYGMQQSTKHLHMGFDIENKEIAVQGHKKRINDYAFLHLGQCIRTDIIKTFLDEHNIKYYEEQ